MTSLISNRAATKSSVKYVKFAIQAKYILRILFHIVEYTCRNQKDHVLQCMKKLFSTSFFFFFDISSYNWVLIDRYIPQLSISVEKFLFVNVYCALITTLLLFKI